MNTFAGVVYDSICVSGSWLSAINWGNFCVFVAAIKCVRNLIKLQWGWTYTTLLNDLYVKLYQVIHVSKTSKKLNIFHSVSIKSYIDVSWRKRNKYFHIFCYVYKDADRLDLHISEGINQQINKLIYILYYKYYKVCNISTMFVY